jgi:hypothetical protein
MCKQEKKYTLPVQPFPALLYNSVALGCSVRTVQVEHGPDPEKRTQGCAAWAWGAH